MVSGDSEIQRALGRVESKLDMVLIAVNDHSERLDALERSKAWLLGACAAIGAVSGIIAKALLPMKDS